jgi:hypothetical protein
VDQLQQPLSSGEVDLAAVHGNISSKVNDLNQFIGEIVASMLVVVTSFGALEDSPSRYRFQLGSSILLRKLYQATPNSEPWQSLLQAALRDAILVQLEARIFGSPPAVFSSPSLRRVWNQAKSSCGEWYRESQIYCRS